MIDNELKAAPRVFRNEVIHEPILTESSGGVQRVSMKLFSRSGFSVIPLALFFCFFNVIEVKSQILFHILDRMDAHQKSLSSIRTNVKMEKYSAQLDEYDISEGTAIYQRFAGAQRAVRIDWSKPLTESLSLISDQFVIYRPKLNHALTGRVDKSKLSGSLAEELFFLNMPKKEIKKNFRIFYIGQENVGGTPTWHLSFTPKNSAAYQSADLWVNGNGMPIQIQVLEQNKGKTTVRLTQFVKNTTIKLADFSIYLPKGAKIIRTSADSCPCYKPENARDALENWSDTVFSGTVTAVRGADYVFKIDRTWKDAPGLEETVRNFSTGDDCAIKLRSGERYIVFAQKIKIDGKNALATMPCNLTSELTGQNGKKILKEIGPGTALKKTGIVRKPRRSKR